MRSNFGLGLICLALLIPRPTHPADGGSKAPCVRGGCSGELCTDDPGAVTPCDWQPRYACFKAAACARQPDGRCGFTPTPKLSQCVKAADAKSSTESVQ